VSLFEFVVPLIAFAVAGVGIVLLNRSGRRLDRGTGRHPAK
jgi:hypothetical protein